MPPPPARPPRPPSSPPLPPYLPPYSGRQVQLLLNLSDAAGNLTGDAHAPCTELLARSRPQLAHRLGDACGTRADDFALALDGPNVSEPSCLALLTINSGSDSVAIKACLESNMHGPSALLGYAAVSSPRTSGGHAATPHASATIASSVLGLAATLACLGWLVWQRVRWRQVSLFLSYRVASDAPLVEALYTELQRLGLRVWWDKQCLKPGQPWEDGFCDGLFAARIFVPVLSREGLASFAELSAESPCDNVLLEHVLALEMQRRGVLRAIFPVFVGDTDPADCSVHGHFFACGGLPSCGPDGTAVEAVDAKAREHLARKLGWRKQELRVPDRSPGGVLAQLCRHQGGFLEGEREGDLRRLASLLQVRPRPAHQRPAHQPRLLSQSDWAADALQGRLSRAISGCGARCGCGPGGGGGEGAGLGSCASATAGLAP